jgi:hypothetical protein
MRLLLAAGFFLVAAPAFAAPAIDTREMIAGAVEGYVRPGFHQLATDSAALETGLGVLCATPSASALEAVREEFRQAVLAFSRIEFLRMGPLNVADRAERLLFWPDNKGIALRQVQQALAQQDPTAATPDTLRKKSVAMQGLGALEYVLFGTGGETLATADGAYRCSYGHAIATLVAGLTATIDGEWQDNGPDGQVQHMLDPQPDAQDFRTSLEVVEKLSGSLITGNEAIRDQRLTPILSPSDGRLKPKSALFWRSGMTTKALEANFSGLKALFDAGKYAEGLGVANAWITRGVRYEYDLAIAAAASFDAPLEKLTADPALVEKLKAMVTVTGTLDTMLGTNLAQALGLSVGFSQLDGD